MKADLGWLEVHEELLGLHERKSATYGRDGDRLANFSAVGEATGQPPERYAVERVLEKCVRALNMIDAGMAADVREYRDIASLGIVAETLRRRAYSE